MAFFDIPLNMPSSFHPQGLLSSAWNNYPLCLSLPNSYYLSLNDPSGEVLP